MPTTSAADENALLDSVGIPASSAADPYRLEGAAFGVLSAGILPLAPLSAKTGTIEDVSIGQASAPLAALEPLLGLRRTRSGTPFVGLQIEGRIEDVPVFAALVRLPDGRGAVLVPAEGNLLCPATCRAFGRSPAQERAWLAAQGLPWEEDPDAMAEILAPLVAPDRLEAAIDAASRG